MSEEEQTVLLKLFATLNEAQARWFVAREVMALGRGGLKTMAELTDMSKPTILRGLRELRQREPLNLTGRVRSVGGGRKRLETNDPGVVPALQEILQESTGGDPSSALIWTNKSTTDLARELTRRGHPISQRSVDRKLLEQGYSLQLNVKTKEGHARPERDQQFRHINGLVKASLERGEPVLSVDTQTKERVGNFKNTGKNWRLRGKPVEVNGYDFPYLSRGTAIPYGTYDVGRNEGVVDVGLKSRHGGVCGA